MYDICENRYLNSPRFPPFLCSMLSFLGPRPLSRVLDGITDSSQKWECVKSEQSLSDIAFRIKQGQLHHQVKVDGWEDLEDILLKEKQVIMIRDVPGGVIVCCSDASQWYLDWYGTLKGRVQSRTSARVLSQYQIPSYSTLMDEHLKPRFKTRFRRWISNLIH